MARGRGSILIDARVNALAGGHGLARSVMNLTAQLSEPDDGRTLRVLAHVGRPQTYPLERLPAHADVVHTDVAATAPHRCRELARLIRDLDAAVLYVPYPTFTPPIRPCPFVVTYHDCTIESDVAFAGNRLRQASIRTITGMVLRRAAAVTAPSRASAADIRRHYPDAPPATLVPNGVSTAQFGRIGPRLLTAARHRYRLPRRFVLAVGARRPHKNHEVLVRAMTRIPDDVGLVVVGYVDPGFRDRLPGLIHESGLAHRVTLVPEVADDLLPAVYRAASVFAFPSLAEGYGIPVVEAMAAGVPVVMSDLPVLAEIAGRAAVRVPPRDVDAWARAITHVLGDAALARRLIADGDAVARASGWEHGAGELSRLLSAVAAGRPAKALAR